METLEQLRGIVKNAPCDATHYYNVTGSYHLIRNFSFYDYDIEHDYWLLGSPCSEEMRSLSDVKRIIELMEENKELYEESAKDKGL